MALFIALKRPLILLGELASREVTGIIGLSGMSSFAGLRVHGATQKYLDDHGTSSAGNVKLRPPREFGSAAKVQSLMFMT